MHKNIIAVIEEVLKAAKLKYSVDKADKPIVRYNIELKGNAETSGLLANDPSVNQLAFYIIFHKKSPPQNFGNIVEYITIINSGLSYGNFEFDYTDGTVMFKNSFEYSGYEVEPAMIRNIILQSFDVLELYEVDVEKVISGKLKASQAKE